MIVKLLTEHHLNFLSLKGGCRGSSESTFVKMSNFWKSHATAQLLYKTLKEFMQVMKPQVEKTRALNAHRTSWYGLLLDEVL